MRNKKYRASYIDSHTRDVLAKQMREFRGSMTQMEFAKLLGRRQSVISRLENPSYIGWNLKTLFDIAKKLDIAVVIRFIDVPTFINLAGGMSDEDLHPQKYQEPKEAANDQDSKCEV